MRARFPSPRLRGRGDVPDGIIRKGAPLDSPSLTHYPETGETKLEKTCETQARCYIERRR